MSVIENQRKRHTSAPSKHANQRREFRNFSSTAAITPGGLAIRLLRYFIRKDGKWIVRPGEGNVHCLFRHLIDGKPYVVQLIGAQPSGRPMKWGLTFVTIDEPIQKVTLTVDKPAFKIKLPEAQAVYS